MSSSCNPCDGSGGVTDIEDILKKANFEDDAVLAVRTDLVDWYRLNRRKLPWR
jgi:hypothetical protein